MLLSDLDKVLTLNRQMSHIKEQLKGLEKASRITIGGAMVMDTNIPLDVDLREVIKTVLESRSFGLTLELVKLGVELNAPNEEALPPEPPEIPF